MKKDFIPLLAKNPADSASEDMNGLSLDDQKNNRPMTLFQCQLKLFKQWNKSWTVDQREYLVLRLKDMDSSFHDCYSEYLDIGDDMNKKPKDYFDPGVPPELVRASRKDSSASSSPNVSINGKEQQQQQQQQQNGAVVNDNDCHHNDDDDEVDDNDDDHEDVFNQDREPLSTIQEDE
jgi:hypothetical protein